jgi:hypothetical protein
MLDTSLSCDTSVDLPFPCFGWFIAYSGESNVAASLCTKHVQRQCHKDHSSRTRHAHCGQAYGGTAGLC